MGGIHISYQAGFSSYKVYPVKIYLGLLGHMLRLGLGLICNTAKRFKRSYCSYNLCIQQEFKLIGKFNSHHKKSSLDHLDPF